MIVTDEAQLRLPCDPVLNVREGGEVARKLTATLARVNKHAAKTYRRSAGKKSLTTGVGLAAPQIGIRKAVAVVKTGSVPLVLMNPVVVDASSATIPFREGCLSFPGVEVKTLRHVWVKLKCLNHPGVITLGPTGRADWGDDDLILASVAAQHELDHLAGILFGDRAYHQETAAA